MNRYEITFYNRSIGSDSTIIVFAESFVLAIYAFTDNRYGSSSDIVKICRKDKAV